MRLADEVAKLAAGGPGSGRHAGTGMAHSYKEGDRVTFNHPEHGVLPGYVVKPSTSTMEIGYRHPKTGAAQTMSVHHTKVFPPMPSTHPGMRKTFNPAITEFARKRNR